MSELGACIGACGFFQETGCRIMFRICTHQFIMTLFF